ncbi:MAG: maleylacetoacetate isomerase [Pseudomonadota bacterium]
MSDVKLYGYWRSSAAFRLRIALNLKGVAFENISVNIAPGADEQLRAEHKTRNPQGRVPVIETSQGVSGQSMAILEWLEEAYPEPALLPSEPWERLACRAFADIIACDIHPINNVSVLGRLSGEFSADQDAVGDWYRHWITQGFTALEALAADRPEGSFLFGDAPSLAEVCLVPQMWNARRFKTSLDAFPRLVATVDACKKIDAFDAAAPENQPDAR